MGSVSAHYRIDPYCQVFKQRPSLQKETFTLTDSQATTDVVFIIDTSISMEDDIRKVESSLEAFLQSIAADSRSNEFQVFILAGRNHLTFRVPRSVATNSNFDFEGSNHSVTSHNALGIARNFLSGSLRTPRLNLQSGD